MQFKSVRRKDLATFFITQCKLGTMQSREGAFIDAWRREENVFCRLYFSFSDASLITWISLVLCDYRIYTGQL